MAFGGMAQSGPKRYNFRKFRNFRIFQTLQIKPNYMPLVFPHAQKVSLIFWGWVTQVVFWE